MNRNKKHLILSPGRLIDESNALELKDALFCPKVGGKAIFPTTCGIEDGHIDCSNCTNPMSFVASTPILGQGDQSTVYIFGCLEEGCGGGKGSWKVYRWTPMHVSHDDVPEEEEKQEKKPKDAWGLDDDDDEAFDLADLEEQLKSLGQPSTVRKERKDVKTATDAKCLFDGRLPSFYLVQSEDIYSTLRRNNNSDDDDDDDDDDGAVSGNGIPRGPDSEDDAEDTGDAGVVSWDGELYEKDVVLRTGTGQPPEEDASFLRFMRQLSAVPDQCMRVYNADIKDKNIPYIWPSERIQETLCSRCGSSRICVLQCMSPIISALDEACEMTGGSSQCYKSPPFSWNWATLAVSVCSSLCTHETLIEEHINVLGEA